MSSSSKTRLILVQIQIVPFSCSLPFFDLPILITTLSLSLLLSVQDVSVFTTDVSLPVFYEDYEIGRAILPDFDLYPGLNVLNALVRYQPADANSTTAQQLLTSYLQPPQGTTGTQEARLVLDGSRRADGDPVTPFASISPAIEGLTIRTVLQGIGSRLLDSIAVFIGAST